MKAFLTLIAMCVLSADSHPLADYLELGSGHVPASWVERNKIVFVNPDEKSDLMLVIRITPPPGAEVSFTSKIEEGARSSSTAELLDPVTRKARADEVMLNEVNEEFLYLRLDTPGGKYGERIFFHFECLPDANQDKSPMHLAMEKTISTSGKTRDWITLKSYDGTVAACLRLSEDNTTKEYPSFDIKKPDAGFGSINTKRTLTYELSDLWPIGGFRRTSPPHSPVNRR